jgi:hypothetical protein
MRTRSNFLIALIVYGVVLIVGIALSLWILTLLWAWIVPDVFAGMVKLTMLPARITLWQAFKLDVFLWAVLGASSVSSRSSRK